MDAVGKPARIAILILVITCLAATSCTFPSDNDPQENIYSITKPYKFSISKWEIDALGHQLWESLKPASQIDINDTETVRAYFTSIGQDESKRKQLENEAERILSYQIREALIEEGITNPLDAWIPMKMVFPSVNFEFESPPGLLVISPRDEIRLLKRTTLEADLTSKEKEQIESEVDSLGYSSLVVRLGGVGFTYPTMVYETPNIQRAIDIAVEEWFHQYMALHPLGFLYVLDSIGWRPDYDIITMNETTAGIVSKEIGARVYQKYYAGDEPEISPPVESDFDFDLQMRQIRTKVDEYLAEGKVDLAEKYMRQMRDFLASKGYHIRKLNQAYFAFHGTYADEPGTTSPIGQGLQNLREECSSLKEFLDKVAVMTDYDDLKKAVEESEK